MIDPAAPIVMPTAAVPLVSLLIPTTNQSVKLAACLRSLATHLPPGVPCEIIVVLNAATEEVRHLVRHGCTGLKIAESEANLGVAGGYNRARSLATGEFLVLLHDDVEIGPGWLEPLLATAATHPAAGAIGSRTFNSDGTPQRAGSILWRNGLNSPAEPPAEHPDAPWPVDYCGTCAMFVRTALWDALGGLDEEIYPAYFVDVDLCMGLRRLGAIVLCDPDSTLRHHSRSSSPKPFRDFFVARNHVYFLHKWADALKAYEPWSDNDQDSLSRAFQQTKQTAEELSARWQPIAPAAAPPHDPIRQEIRHFQLAAALAEAWSRHLMERAEAAEAKVAFRKQENIQLREKLKARDRKVANLRAHRERLRAELGDAGQPGPWQRLGRWWRNRLSPRPPASGPAAPPP